MLSLSTAKSGALIGVLISVTTIRRVPDREASVRDVAATHAALAARIRVLASAGPS